MLALIVDFRIKPVHANDFAAAIVENARASREGEPGCHQFDVCRDPADPTHFFLYELYDDEVAFQSHLESSHFIQMNEATALWVEQKKVWRLERLAP